MKNKFKQSLSKKIKDNHRLESLNDFELGILNGYLLAKREEDLTTEMDAISSEDIEFSRGTQYGYLEFQKPQSSDIDLKEAIDSYRANKSRENFVRILDAYDHLLNIIDEDFTIYNKNNNYYVGVEYSRDEIEKMKKALEEDDTLEIAAETEDGYVLGEKMADAEEYELKKVNNNKYEVIKGGVPTYTLEKKNVNWACNCPGFIHRGKCKHLGLLEDVIPKRKPRAEVEAFLPEIENVFRDFDTWSIVGSWRRGKDTVKDIDILVQCDKNEFGKVLERLQEDPNYVNTMNGPDIIRGNYRGFDFDVTRVNEGEWGAYLLYRTGNANFNMKMRAFAKKKGYRLNEHGLFDQNGACIARETEEDIFKALGLRYLKPEEREM